MTKSPRPSGRDYQACLACAEAFQKVAEPFVWSISGVREGGQNSLDTNVADLIACAVNLGFALELYLKALLGFSEVQINQTHDLRRLYDSLPKHIREALDIAYSALKSEWLGKQASVSVAKGPRDTPSWGEYGRLPKDLPSVLQRSRNLFEAWRYIWEFTETEDRPYQIHEFEYGLLLCACNAAKAHGAKLSAEHSARS